MFYIKDTIFEIVFDQAEANQISSLNSCYLFTSCISSADSIPKICISQTPLSFPFSNQNEPLFIIWHCFQHICYFVWLMWIVCLCRVLFLIYFVFAMYGLGLVQKFLDSLSLFSVYF